MHKKNTSIIDLYCVVRHGKNETNLDSLGNPTKLHNRPCENNLANTEFESYKPGACYSLFTPPRGVSRSIVSLKRPIKGFLIEKYFMKESGVKKYKESILDQATTYEFERTFPPNAKYFFLVIQPN